MFCVDWRYRNPDVFGSDAHMFNPERWLDDFIHVETPLGVYENLLTFGSGTRSCIGLSDSYYLCPPVRPIDYTLSLRLEARVSHIKGISRKIKISPFLQHSTDANVPCRVGQEF